MKRIAFAAALLAAIARPAAAEPPQIADGKLVDEHHMTLYVFDRDAPGKSACSGTCATNWPPALADAYDKPSGAWSVVTRDDGKLQWAYRERPLYRWKMDQKAGDAGGDGVGGIWHVARP
ncbi:hypothetical protein K6W16_05560 [Burkholderia dolosa]|jgi:predicted lipoprotein with Yx(FWY)xxD motif|uniref:Lipoprotein n=1 Tax=Burkholderia dolosa TaxID=152500 RepID=A0A892HUW6_9BURK|nr:MULTISPECIES: hypothetical protein [Burkholderia]AKE04445.1 hypothetical protein XM57_16810 [Burkholderia cepacia]AJY12683.1 secreted repeat of unknown function family protein [Burkholderia dolosa AU0158]AYZ96389.1 hypothetical protein EGY28_14600 [Burkholderia dolosa]EAY69586.1 hypothetical protein BDAG_02349 [Burkholderia dolosa AU0158]ETP66253.1 hypothetical protein BDSB_13390 [Burkholderia dolosa PC543]